MPFIDGKKFACQACISGHRSNKCAHHERQLFEIRPRGRPCRLCRFCRERAKLLEEGQEGREPEGRCTCFDLPPPLHTVLPSLARQERKRRAAAAKRASRQASTSAGAQETNDASSSMAANANSGTNSSANVHSTDGFGAPTFHTRLQSPEYTHTIQRPGLSPVPIPTAGTYGVLPARAGPPTMARESSAPAPPILRLDGTRLPPDPVNFHSFANSHTRYRFLSDAPARLEGINTTGLIANAQPFLPPGMSEASAPRFGSYCPEQAPLSTSQPRKLGQLPEPTPTGYVANAQPFLPAASQTQETRFTGYCPEQNVPGNSSQAQPSCPPEQDASGTSQAPKSSFEAYGRPSPLEPHNQPAFPAMRGAPQLHSLHEYPITHTAHDSYAPNLPTTERPAFPAHRSWDGTSDIFRGPAVFAHGGESSTSESVSYRDAHVGFAHDAKPCNSDRSVRQRPHGLTLHRSVDSHSLLHLQPDSHGLSSNWTLPRFDVQSQPEAIPTFVAANTSSSSLYPPPANGQDSFTTTTSADPPSQPAFPHRDYELQ